jgi:hypothetical protein
MKCDHCGKNYSPDCDYRQGRCPQHPPLIVLRNIINLVKKVLRG